MAIKYLSKVGKNRLKGTALVRSDFNDDGFRMEKSIPTLKYLLKYADKIVVMGHKGRPKPSPALAGNAKFSLEDNAKELSKLLDRKVEFLSHMRLSEAGNDIRRAEKGSVFLLENLRFIDGEMENNREIGEHLASFGDYYINEAFSMSHRENASIVSITKFLPSYAGFQFEKEIINLTKVLKPKKPLVVIFGGAKMATKLPVIIKYRDEAKALLVGGALANTLMYLEGEKVGASLVEKEIDGTVLRVAKLPNLITPKDYIKKGTKILDIGPATEREFKSYIKSAKTIIWNGPMGKFEEKGFDEGTKSIARAVGNSKAFTVVGGGETVTFIRKFKLEDKYNFVSTGGAAMLEFLAGKELPGIKALGR